MNGMPWLPLGVLIVKSIRLPSTRHAAAAGRQDRHAR